jgi:hypothetical protein
MDDKRFEPRMLCADLVEIYWKDKTGKDRKAIANLEDISGSGACLQLELAVPLQTTIQIGYPKGKLHGRVRYCVYREIGYFLGVEFDPGQRWSKSAFKPQYMFDPRQLVKKFSSQLEEEAVAG